MDLILDIVEPQEGILFVAGSVGKALTVGDSFNTLAVYQSPKKKKHNPKKLSAIVVQLIVENILVEGEPLDTISAGTTAHVGLVGDAEPILKLMSDHDWHESNGRFFLPRKEIRLITLSGD